MSNRRGAWYALVPLVLAGLVGLVFLGGLIEYPSSAIKIRGIPLVYWEFWGFAFFMSLFYGLAARAIFQFPDSYAYAHISSQDVSEIWKLWSWKFHQFWINFLGSMIGWAIGYYVAIERLKIPLLQSTQPNLPPVKIATAELVLMLVSALGITGQLPNVLGSISSGIGSVAVWMRRQMTG